MTEGADARRPTGPFRLPQVLRRSLPARLTAAFLAVSITVLALATLVSYEVAERALRARVLERLEGVADENERSLAEWLDRQRRGLDFAAGLGSLRAAVAAGDTVAIGALLDDVAGELVASTEIQLLAVPGGRVLASTDRRSVGAFAVAERFYVEGQKAPFTQTVYPHSVTAAPTLSLATPVRDRDRTVAVLAAHLDLATVDTVLATRPGSLPIVAFLVNGTYQFLSSTRFGAGAGARGAHSIAIDRAVARERGSGLYEDHTGRTVLGVWRWLPRHDLALVVEAPRDAAFAPMRQLLLGTLATGLAAILLLTLGVVAITRRATAPILAVATAAEQVADGDFSATATVDSEDEVGRLADRFNAMTRRLRDLVRELNAQIVTTQRALEEARASRSLLQDLADNTSVLIGVLGLDGTVRLANAQLETLLGRERWSVQGRPLRDCLDPETATRLMPVIDDVIADGRTAEIELILGREDDQHLWQATVVLLRDGRREPYAIGLLATDLTERARAEEERRQRDATVQQAQKLESLGIMAGGIAHDFNNILGAVLGNADLALDMLDDREAARAALEQITAAARRAADLTRQMLAYAGRASLRRDVIDIRDVLIDIVALVRAAQPKKVAFMTEPMLEPLWVEIDPSQLSQVALNLLTNAAEAIGDRSGTVRLAARWERSEQGAGWIHLSVADDGAGMPAEVRRRIFEPFYTTKRSGRGLGLSAVMGIIRSAEGQLELHSAPGEGTRFDIRLPAALPPGSRPPGRGSGEVQAAGATVLVIDDEESLRRVARRGMERRGLVVLEAPDGEQGLAIFDAHRAQVALVVLDLTMPGLGGMEVLSRLRERRPDLPVIIASGYAESSAPGIAADPRVRYLQKPFGIKMLLRAVDELLL
jgi:PAS domain S-box-containing protein